MYMYPSNETTFQLGGFLQVALWKILARRNMRELLRSTIGNRKGNLEVLLDRVAFDGGETMKGTVVLHVKKATKCGDLVLHIHGAVKVSWYEGYGEGRSLVRRTNQLLDNKITLSTCHDFQPGEYDFGFSYLLPEKLPGSFGRYSEHAKSQSAIEHNPSIAYAVTAYLPMVKSVSFDLKTTQPFAIFPQISDLPQGRFVVAQASATVKLYGFVDKGVCSLSAESDRHTYVTGDTVHVKALIRNNSRLDVSSVKMGLAEDLVFTSNNSEEQTKGTNWFCVLTAPGVRAGETAHRTLKLPLVTKWDGNLINPTTPKSSNICRAYRVLVLCHISQAGDVVVGIPIIVLPQDRPPF